MTDTNDDYHSLMEQKHFLNEIEQGIKFANREIIHKYIPSLDKDRILAFAVTVGRLRAHFLAAAINLGVDESGNPPTDEQISELKTHRQRFEEARSAFDALRDAIEKGYVDIDGMQTKGG